MSAILIRFGLYTILLLLAVFVLREQVNLPKEELLTDALLVQAAIAAVVMLIAGFVMKLFEKAATKLPKGRCIICKRKVLSGQTYCRDHLRELVGEERERGRHEPLPRG
ncbi:MAG TPA: hypothetical protein VM557_04090 [Thermoanaerobaculia bacterium]|nr:hypothetical protein [Thermoanaerobaculia bacterium]